MITLTWQFDGAAFMTTTLIVLAVYLLIVALLCYWNYNVGER